MRALSLILTASLILSSYPRAWAASSKTPAGGVTPIQMQSLALSAGLAKGITAESLKNLAAQDTAPARILTAALTDRTFFETQRAALEILLGGPEAISSLAAHHERTSASSPAIAAKATADLQTASLDNDVFDGRGEVLGLRASFNAGFTPKKAGAYLDTLEKRIGIRVPFTLAPSPVFLPKPLVDRMAQDGADILNQLVTEEYKALSERAIPPAYRLPKEKEAARPPFALVDFSVAKGADGKLEPKLIELAGYGCDPGHQPMFGQAFIDAFGLSPDLRYLLSGLTMEAYHALLKSIIVGNEDPKHIILMEVDPQKQANLSDFKVLEKLLGIKTVNVRDVKKDGRKLYYMDESGARVDIRRVYNRTIPDELERKKVQLDFNFSDDLDVDWVNQHNWFFRISKFSLPFLKHRSAPQSHFVSDLKELPADLENWVLKPLFSFGGQGVNMKPTAADIAAIPEAERANWILQQKVSYEPFIPTPTGLAKAEVRMMYAWVQDKFVPLMTFVRMGYGLIMNVARNTDGWVGQTIALFKNSLGENEALRQDFNARFSQNRYQAFRENLARRAGSPIKDVILPTPVFLPKETMDRVTTAGAEIIRQMVDPGFLAKADTTVPPQYRVKNSPSHPAFIAVDFAMARNAAGELEPRLVELQGVSSEYGYLDAMGQAYKEAFGLDQGLTHLLDGLDQEAYHAMLRRAILGERKAEETILLEIDPLKQPTLPDFRLLGKITGIKPVNIRDVRKDGRKLYYLDRQGNRVDIRRIYNRVVPDELEQNLKKGMTLDFSFADDLDVEWANSPDWAFRMSKFGLPFLSHPSVPESRFLSDVAEIPADLENYVLKPLYSFGSKGVVIGPSRQEIEAIPIDQRGQYLLQKRIEYAPFIAAPAGTTKAEVRILYLWTDKLTPVLTYVRTGQGRFMNQTQQNKDSQLSGISAVLYRP